MLISTGAKLCTPTDRQGIKPSDVGSLKHLAADKLQDSGTWVNQRHSELPLGSHLLVSHSLPPQVPPPEALQMTSTMATEEANHRQGGPSRANRANGTTGESRANKDGQVDEGVYVDDVCTDVCTTA